MSGLSLASAADAKQGGAHGPAIVPGKPEEGMPIKMISGEKPNMQGVPLSAEEIVEIRKWIEHALAATLKRFETYVTTTCRIDNRISK